MSGEPLNAEGKDREMFLVALRSLSNSCEPPQLTPDCPYFEMTNSGPSCAEQCLDRLAENEMPQSFDLVMDLGDGFKVLERKRRVRKGPEPTDRPFDARAIKLHDSERPTATRHTVSLILEYNDLLKTPPKMADDLEERNYLIRASMDELVKRGFDREDLRVAGCHGTSVAMAAFMVGATMEELGFFHDADTPAEAEPAFILDADWARIRDHMLGEMEQKEPADIVGRLMDRDLYRRLFAWNFEQTLEGLCAWTPPPVSIFGPEGSVASPNDQAIWMYDHFAETFITDWSTNSLALEWQYLRGRRPGCAPSSQMSLRRHGAFEIASEYTERLSSRDDDDTITPERGLRPWHFVSVAVEYLTAGRFEAAAAMYEGLQSLCPDDPEVLNNLAFCLMPIDVRRAVQLLERASGMRASAVTYANLALGNLLLGKYDEARRYIEVPNRIRIPPHSYLWEVSADRTFRLLRVDDFKVYMEAIAERVDRSEANEPVR